jgi:hypothetical protein
MKKWGGVPVGASSTIGANAIAPVLIPNKPIRKPALLLPVVAIAIAI